MAYFAQIDQNKVVTQVIVVGNPDCLDAQGNESEAVGVAFCKSLFGKDTEWVQTSYNRRIRKNYAGIGCTYDTQRDAFIPPSPYPSWILNEASCQWEPPVAEPVATATTAYLWNEALVQWDAVEIPPEKS